MEPAVRYDWYRHSRKQPLTSGPDSVHPEGATSRGLVPDPTFAARVPPVGCLTGTHFRPYKGHMKTLTITEAKKNLSRWLAAAARGEDVGIVNGADIIALRKVEVESTDYAQREYGATPDQVAALEKATDKRYRALRRSGQLVTVTDKQLRKMIG
jgi:antitoxin (DNA-binding transcriptional repressor) of toxin-antitoxin stability system